MKTIEQLQEENEALAAQVEALRDDLKWALARGKSGYKWEQQDIDSVGRTINTTPQHHLRQVRADAGRDGFIAGSEQTANFITGEIGYEVPLLEARANQYHARILAGKE